MTKEQQEYDEEQYRNLNSYLESLIDREYVYTNKTNDSIRVKIIDKEKGTIVFKYDGNIINTEFNIVNTNYIFNNYNMLNIAVKELLNKTDTPILMRFLLNYGEVEIKHY